MGMFLPGWAVDFWYLMIGTGVGQPGRHTFAQVKHCAMPGPEICTDRLPSSAMMVLLTVCPNQANLGVSRSQASKTYWRLSSVRVLLSLLSTLVQNGLSSSMVMLPVPVPFSSWVKVNSLKSLTIATSDVMSL